MDFDKITGIVAILLFFAIIGFYVFCVSVISPDERGIVFRHDGGLDKENIFSGHKITAPWDQLIIYNITTQEGSEQMSIQSKDGFTYRCKFTYRFRVKPNKIAFLHEEVGRDYHEIVIKPELRSVVREEFGRYTSTKIAAMENMQFGLEVYHRAQRGIEEKYLLLESVSIQEIIAPLK